MKRPLANAILAILLAATPFAQVIDTHTTVRHHREAVEVSRLRLRKPKMRSRRMILLRLKRC